MLRQLRKGVKSLTAKILIGLLVASFAIWGIGDIFSFRLDSAVAYVGNTKVSAQRFADALARERARLTRESRQPITYDLMRQAGVDRAILNGLIRDAAFAEELRALGLSAPDEAVADAIRNNSAFQGPGGKFSAQAYQLLLRQQGMSPSEFEELIRSILAQQILTETVRAVAPPIPGLAARIAAFQGEKRGINLLALGLDAVPEPAEPDEATLRAFYEAHTDLFTEPERRSGQYLHVNAGKLLAELRPSEDELRAAYEAERERFTVEETRAVDLLTFADEAKARDAVERLESGTTTFEDLAKELGLAENELSLGTVTRRDLPGKAAEAVFATREPGIVGPVKLPAGWGVYRVHEITPGGVKPFEEVKEQLAEEKARDALARRAPEIAAEIEELRAAGLTMEEIAQKTDAEWGQFEGLARDGTLADGSKAEGVLASETFLGEAFAALEAEERDPVETPDGGYLFVMVEEIAPSALKPFEDVRDDVLKAWKEAERLKALEKKGEELAARLGEDFSIWELGEELTVAVLPIAPFTRTNPPEGVPPALVEKVFRAPAGGGVAALDTGAKRVVIAQVASIVAPTPEQIARASERIDEALKTSLAEDLETYFAQALIDKYEPTIDVAVVEEVFRRLGASDQP